MVELENHHRNTKKTHADKRGSIAAREPGEAKEKAPARFAIVYRCKRKHFNRTPSWKSQHIKTWGAGFGRGGVPDLIICADGRFVALEVKNEAGRVSKLQELEARHIRKSGGVIEVVRSLDEAIAVLDLHC